MKLLKFKLLIIAILMLSLLALGIAWIKHKGYSINYQATSSMPKGFYWVTPVKNIQRQDVVIFSPPKISQGFLLRHHWVPKSGLLIKKVFGIPGDRVCTREHFIWVNQKKVGYIYDFYAPGKKLPKETFCRTLGKDEYLLISINDKRSYDGRYFGPINKNQIYGEATFLFSC